MFTKNVSIDGLKIPYSNKIAVANLNSLKRTVNKLTTVSSKSNITVGRYKSGRFYAKVLVNHRFMFTCGLEIKDTDYGCQIARIGTNGWTKEDIIRKPLFGMITDYLAAYVSIANNIKAYL